MSGDSQRWALPLALLEQLLDGRLLDASMLVACADGAHACWTLCGDDLGNPGPVPNEQTRQRLSRAVGRLGALLTQLAAAPTNPAAAGEGQRSPQQTAALVTTDACLKLMIKAEMGGQQLSRLAAGINTLLFASGQRFMEQGYVVADIDSPHAFGLKCEVQVVHRLLQVLRNPWAAAIRPDVAKQATAPGRLLPWLVAVGRALQASATNPGAGEDAGGTRVRIATQMIEILSMIIRFETELTARLAADHQQQRQLSEAILTAVTLLVQQEDGKGDAHATPSGRSSTSSGSGSAAAPAQQAQPAQQAGDGQTREWWQTVFNGLNMLTGVLVHGTSQVATQGGEVRLLVPATTTLRLVVATGPQLAMVHRPLFCTVALKLASAAVCDGVGCNAGRANAGVVTALLRIAPVVVAVIQLCATDGVCAPDGFDLGCVMWLSWLVLNVVPHTREGVGQLADWCLAADALLRLMPLLCAVHVTWRGRTIQGPLIPELPAPNAHPSRAAEVLAGVAFESWGHLLAQLPGRLCSAAAGQREAAAADEAQPLWQLHSTVCRLLHWAAAQSKEQLAVLPSLSDWGMLYVCASRGFVFALEGTRVWLRVASGRPEEAARARRRLQAICAAHSKVLPLLAERQGMCLEDLAASSPADVIRWHGVVAATPPALLPPGLMSAAENSLRRGMRGQHALEALVSVLGYAVEWLPSAALLLSSGLLAQGLAVVEAVGLPPPRMVESFEVVRRLFNDVFMVCVNVAVKCDAQLGTGGSNKTAAPAGDSAALSGSDSGAESSSSSSSSRPAVEAALASLHAAIEQCKRQGGGQGAPPTLALHLYKHTLIPAATTLAQALQVWWAEPEQRAAQQLEGAQVAATRSCAYLCCANLGTTAGPAAGPGQGTKRCSGCRAVWYCGTACSGADWRAGHRRVCKALAAARQKG